MSQSTCCNHGLTCSQLCSDGACCEHAHNCTDDINNKLAVQIKNIDIIEVGMLLN